MYKLKCACYQNITHVHHCRTTTEWSSAMGTTCRYTDINVREEDYAISSEI